MLKYLDEDDFKKLQILYYLENHHLSTVLFDDLIEEWTNVKYLDTK
ncbi:hypothetical protein V4331_06990 [Lactococcus formosensis subsp. formosensis]|nr:hypothetical protein NALG_1859 [Lactococcus formosensis]BDW49649.1 hypothetical protein LG21E20_13110 [Lactococcus formosensis]BDX25237.1 hypothetical protein LFMS200408A_13140 [Lactococcus formosensis]